jgi:outer membrane receptor protein involved in Fe transport
MKKTHLLVGATAFALATAVAQPAFAQDDSAAASAEEACEDADNNGVCDSEETGQKIVVTGTRIARPTLDSSVPLTSVTVEDLTGTGNISLGDALNDLPSLRSTFSSGNSGRFIGTAGLSALDLRGLGTDRTLVLVNGRRHVTSSPGDNFFDVNTIPTDLVDRVDIVTGGNSAVYGSDAVAGVVNFIMRRDYDGISIRGQGGTSQRGDNTSFFLSGIFGRNFADGRGNFAVSAEYTRQQPLYLRDRDSLTGAFSGRCGFSPTDPTVGEPAAGDGIPDSEFFCGIKNGGISDGGTVGRVGTGSYLRFAPDGSLIVDTFTTNFEAAGGGNGLGANSLGSTLTKTGSLLAEVDRYAFNVLAHYDISEAFKPYFEGKFVRTNASAEGQPSFWQNSIPGFFGGGSNLSCSNPFLTAQNLLALQTTPGLAAAQRCLTPTSTFTIQRFNVDFGGRRLNAKRDTLRFVGGVEGTFNEDWRYDLAVNYGKFKGKNTNNENLRIFDLAGNPDGFLLAVDAVLAPATFTGSNFVLNSAGQRVICRVNAVTNTRPDCVPLNVFGEGRADPRALAFIDAPGSNIDKASQLVFSANVSGDLSQLFELPGGPISFAVGAEYRKETASQDYDELTSSGGTFLNALQDFTPPDAKVKEAYGEILFPILKDSPLGKEFSINLAGRVSDYSGAQASVGTVYAYNIQGIYAPIDDIRLRASYATSVRAPTQSDLFTPLVENFAFIADPCSQTIIGNGPNRVANCLAANVPTTFNAAASAACGGVVGTAVGQPWFNCIANQVSTGFQSGGNPTLTEERGKSLTIGAIFEPSFLPGFSLTVDYYNIKVKSLISALSAQATITNCYESPEGLASSFCSTIQRDPATGFFVEPAVISRGVNFAAQRTKGFDFDLAYRKTFDNGDRIRIRGIATLVKSLNNFINASFPNEPNRQLSELGDPEFSFNANIFYDWGDFDFLYNLRYIGKQINDGLTYETFFPHQRACPFSGTTPNTGGPASNPTLNGPAVPCTPGTIVTVQPNNADARANKWLPDVFYHDIRIGFDVGNDFRFTAGVNNLFDKLPPNGLLGTAGGDPFDSTGRNFFFGVSAEF